MNPRVIYKNEAGGVAVIVPSPEAIAIYGIKAIADKDVPTGLPYKIVDANDIPEDRTFRDAWEIDTAELNDGVGSDLSTFKGNQ